MGTWLGAKQRRLQLEPELTRWPPACRVQHLGQQRRRWRWQWRLPASLRRRLPVRRSLSEPPNRGAERQPGTAPYCPSSPAPACKQRLIGRRARERSSHWPHAPSFSSPPQATGGLVEDSEDEGSLRFGLHDLGRGPACGSEGTGKEGLGGMTHPSPRFLPTSGSVAQERGVRNPSPQRGGWQRGWCLSTASAFGLQL